MGLWERRGPEGYARRKREGREVKVLNGWVEGETGGNNAKMLNILQSICYKKEAKKIRYFKKGPGSGNARYRKRELWTSPPTPHPPPPSLLPAPLSGHNLPQSGNT